MQTTRLRTVVECLIGNSGAGVLLKRHPATVARAAVSALRKVVNRA